MATNPEFEKEFEESFRAIEDRTQEEIKKITKKLAIVKTDAEKTGEALDASLNREQF